jgi:hypothetical protein
VFARTEERDERRGIRKGELSGETGLRKICWLAIENSMKFIEVWFRLNKEMLHNIFFCGDNAFFSLEGLLSYPRV